MKPELTQKVKIDDVIHTGDMGEIDEKGFLYIWGRMDDKLITPDGEEMFLFDISRKIIENPAIDDAMVFRIPTVENDNNLVAHIVWDPSIKESQKAGILEEINKCLNDFLPAGVTLSGYYEHEVMLPYSPTTLKKDKNGMVAQTKNYKQVINGEVYNIEFILNENGKYSQKCAIIEEDKVKSLKRK